MTLYNTLNVKLSNSQLNKLISGIKNGTEVILSLSSNTIDNSNDEANVPRKLLPHISRLHKAFANNVMCNIKLSKTQLSKIGQSGGLLGRLLEPFLKTVLSLMKKCS